MEEKEFITRRYSFWRSSFLPRIIFLLYGVPKYSFGSVDVTNKCNLRCKHCYYYADEETVELECDELVGRIGEILGRNKKGWSCTWVGGEPLLRKGLVERLKGRFKTNLLVTNGTIPLPDWKDVSFYISVDGTEEIHDRIRGKGVYQRLKKNVIDPKNYGKTIRLACCLNQLNKGCIEAILEEWYPCPNIKEVVFDFYTPFKGVDDELWIPFEERDRILDKLIHLKRRNRYGRFIGATEGTYHLMKGRNRGLATGKKCVFKNKGFAISSAGKLKEKCMLGPKADCDRCGCIVPFYLKSLSRSNLFK